MLTDSCESASTADHLLFPVLILEELQRYFFLVILCLSCSTALAAERKTQQSFSHWQQAANNGFYDEAVSLSAKSDPSGTLQGLINAAKVKRLSERAQWRAFIHYKPDSAIGWLSQVDSPHFFMSQTGKKSPEAELNATLAALFASKAKLPLRLTAYCRFVARRIWLEEQLPDALTLIPQQECTEFERYKEFLDADVLTLVFPTAHPNSPSSAFGHTLLRIDKKDQRAESRLLNMSLNFAADVPPNEPATSYAIKGLSGGFKGRFRLLPYHIKLREYGQIENRDTWEYELALDKAAVELVVRHAYEMLISHYDYYFFSENCSYHLLSLIEVALPETPLTESFELWTIPVDTIRKLEEQQLVKAPRFVPSSIRTLRARQSALSADEVNLSLRALHTNLESIDTSLKQKTPEKQVAILDLLSDYERYNRLKTDTNSQGSSAREIAILSRRSKLGLTSVPPEIEPPKESPDAGHGTSRLAVQYHYSPGGSKQVELSFRPAYHDFKDPSLGYDDKASIEMGLISIAHDADANEFFLKQFTLISIESLEPRGTFFKPVSWKTSIQWQRARVNARHQFSFNFGAGITTQPNPKFPVLFAFAEADVINNPALKDRTQLQLGLSIGTQWEPIPRIRVGVDTQARQQIGGVTYSILAEAWVGFALNEQLSINIDWINERTISSSSDSRLSFGLRSYF